jgi:hypothetical protein
MPVPRQVRPLCRPASPKPEPLRLRWQQIEHAAGRLIPLTRHEIRRLFTGLCQQQPAPRLQLHRSRWRRRHQAAARACHCRRRAGQLT